MIHIPFCTRMDTDLRHNWEIGLNDALQTAGIQIVPMEELSAKERAQVEVAVVANPEPRELMDLPKLRWVQSLWAGVERLVAELGPLPIAIVRMEDPQMAQTMSEAVLTATLYLHRQLPLYARQQAERRWVQHTVQMPAARCIGLLGFGKLGQVTGERLIANGFRVQAWTRHGGSHPDIPIYGGEAELPRLLSSSDILVLLMPLTEETRALLDAERFNQMKKGVSVINFARGPIIDEEALLAALASGQVGHAVLDVYAQEPLPEEHPFWSHPNITILPHISAPTTIETASKIAARHLIDFQKNGTIPKSVEINRGY